MFSIYRKLDLGSSFKYAVIFKYEDISIDILPCQNGPQIALYLARKLKTVNAIKCNEKEYRVEFAFSSKADRDNAIKRINAFKYGIEARKGYHMKQQILTFRIDGLPMSTTGKNLKKVLQPQLNTIGEITELDMLDFHSSEFGDGSCTLTINTIHKIPIREYRELEVLIDDFTLKCKIV